MKISRTFDADIVNAIITHPKIYKHVTDDGSPAPEDYDVSQLMQVQGVFVLLAEDTAPCGVVTFVPTNCISVNAHIAILPEAWGQSEAICRGAIDWLFSNTATKKIECVFPESNMFVFKLVRKCGFALEGVNRLSFLRNGILLDQYNFGMTQEDWLCH